MDAVLFTRRAMLQNLALRTDVMVLRRIKSEGLARKQAIGLVLPIKHWNMRDDFPFR